MTKMIGSSLRKRSRLDWEDTLQVFSRPRPRAHRPKEQRKASWSDQGHIGRKSHERRTPTWRVPGPAQDQGRRLSGHLHGYRRGCALLENRGSEQGLRLKSPARLRHGFEPAARTLDGLSTQFLLRLARRLRFA